MSMAWDHYREVMSEFDESPYNRPHLADCGYEYEDGYWFAMFVDKEVVARKDHPKFNIKKGEKHRFIKMKYICDDTGCSSWEVERKALGVVATLPVNPTPVSPSTTSVWGSTTPTKPNLWNTNAWNFNIGKDK